MESCEINETSLLLYEEFELTVLDVDEQTEGIPADEENETDSSGQSGDVGFDMSNRVSHFHFLFLYLEIARL